MAEWSGVRGKQFVITGATSGIGLAAARALAARGARLAIVARDEGRASAAAASISASGGGAPVDVLLADLAAQTSVRGLAAEILRRWPRLDVLVNNAGAVFSARRLTADGVEMTWALNHLAPFLLTNLLLDQLKASAPARVITTASDAHRGARLRLDDLDGARSPASLGFARYGESKLANILFTAELARRLEGTGVTAACFHPGVVRTNFNRNNGPLMNLGMTLIGPFVRSPERGAETLVWLAESPEVTAGGYYFDRKLTTPSPAARDMESARRLWEASEARVGSC